MCDTGSLSNTLDVLHAETVELWVCVQPQCPNEHKNSAVSRKIPFLLGTLCGILKKKTEREKKATNFQITASQEIFRKYHKNAICIHKISWSYEARCLYKKAYDLWEHGGAGAAHSRGLCHNGSAHMFAAETLAKFTFKLWGWGETRGSQLFGGMRLLLFCARQNLVVVPAVVNFLGDGGGKQTWFGSLWFFFFLPSSVKSCTEQKFQPP